MPEIPALTGINLCYELSVLFPFCHFHQAYYLLPNTNWIWLNIGASRVVSFYAFLPFSSLICVSQSVCTCVSVLVRENPSERVCFCLQSLTVKTYFQRWHLIHANKSPRRPSAFHQAYPLSRSVSTQAGVIKANRWLGEWSRDKRARAPLPNLIFQPWEPSSETTTIYILIFNTQRGIQLITASLILLNPFQLYLA